MLFRVYHKHALLSRCNNDNNIILDIGINEVVNINITDDEHNFSI